MAKKKAKRTTKVAKKVTKKPEPRAIWLARDARKGLRGCYCFDKTKPRNTSRDSVADWTGVPICPRPFESLVPQLKLKPGAKPRKVVGLECLRFAE